MIQKARAEEITSSIKGRIDILKKEEDNQRDYVEIKEDTEIKPKNKSGRVRKRMEK